MTIPQTLRSVIPLAIGLTVGGIGVAMFIESMPGAEGSAKERADRLEVELKQAQKRIAAIEAVKPQEHRRPGQTFTDQARNIVEDLRAGRPVSPDDIFRVAQPVLRDLAPLFDRMRVKQQREVIDRMTGELARKYNLSPENQEKLKKWFEWKMNEEARRWSELVSMDGVRVQDIMRASREARPDDGLEFFMAGVLSPEKLSAFKTERLTERAQRVQQEADMKVQRLNSIVKLDDTQRDQVFGIMARGSKNYDPAMVLEGVTGEIGATAGGDRQAAMLAVLRPDQRAAFDAEQKRRRELAAKEMEAVGLHLPADWQMLDDRDAW